METRVRTEVHVYYMVMNPVTAYAEEGVITVAASSYQMLVGYYFSQLAGEKYKEGRYNLSFIEGPLKWYNPLLSLELNADTTFGHGIHDEWILLEGNMPKLAPGIIWIG